MATPMARSTTTRRLAWAAGAFALLLVLALSLLVVVTRGSWIPGLADCTARVGDREVELDADQAEQAASVSARAVRLGVPLTRATAAVAEVLDLPDADARVVASALTGRTPHALACRHGGSSQTEPDRLDRAGLTGRAAHVRRDLTAAFGPQRVGGFAPGGVSSGHMPGSAHYEGRAVDVFFRPTTSRQRVRGWAVAQYLVANAVRLRVDTVIFDGHIWTARRAAQGWRDYRPDTSGRSARVAAVLEHRDHVHVDVAD
jgi:hypothetical protein